jgi:uncharacterized cysteine cluster protein YcgN (CxxCxxCC family)
MTRVTSVKWWQAGLEKLDAQQWELLCDGCGLCCLHKLQDEDSNEYHYTRLACELLDTKSCECSDYANRSQRVPGCLQLTLANYREMLPWLPNSCAYKRVANGQDLPNWHHLVTGSKLAMHKHGLSVSGKVQHVGAIQEDDYQDYILRWVDA